MSFEQTPLLSCICNKDGRDAGVPRHLQYAVWDNGLFFFRDEKLPFNQVYVDILNPRELTVLREVISEFRNTQDDCRIHPHGTQLVLRWNFEGQNKMLLATREDSWGDIGNQVRSLTAHRSRERIANVEAMLPGNSFMSIGAPADSKWNSLKQKLSRKK